MSAAAAATPIVLALAKVVGVLLVLALTLPLGAWLFIQTEVGREAFADLLERGLDAALPGSVHIGTLEGVDGFTVTVSEFVVREPRGTPVLQLEHVALELSPLDLLRGDLSVPSATVDRGRVVIAVQADGRTGLEAAFHASRPTRRASLDGARGPRVSFSDIRVDDLHVVLRPARDQTLVVREVAGTLSIHSEPGEGVKVALKRIHGVVTAPKLTGDDLLLQRVDGWVHGDALQVMELAFWTRFRGTDAKLDGALSFFDREPTPLKVRLRPHGDAQAHWAATLIWLQSLPTSDVEVDVEPR